MRDLDANGQSTISEIYTDAGNEFTSKEFHEECGKRHIRVLNMPPGEPSPRVERYVRTLRTRVAVIIASLGYKLPITLLSYVHEYAAQINNFLPSEALGSKDITITSSPYPTLTPSTNDPLALMFSATASCPNLILTMLLQGILAPV